MNVRYHIINITRDRRTPDLKQRGRWLEQVRAAASVAVRQEEIDALMLRAWNHRVQLNVLGVSRARDR